MSHPSRIYQTILSNLRPEINSLHKHFSLKKKNILWRKYNGQMKIALFGTIGHLRSSSETSASLAYTSKCITPHLIQGRENLLIVFLPILYKKIIPIKHQATANILFLSTKGVILKLCVQIWFNKVSFSQLFFNIIKNWIKYEFKKKIYWTQKIQWW